MKKIWWSAGACLLLIVLIMIITHAYRRETGPETSEYGNPGAEAERSFNAGFDDQDGEDAGFSPRPPRGNAYAPNMGGQVQPYGSQPGNRGFAQDGSAPPRPRFHEGVPRDENQPPEVEPYEQGPDGDFNGQPAEQAPYEDGNPEEALPPESGIDE